MRIAAEDIHNQKSLPFLEFAGMKLRWIARVLMVIAGFAVFGAIGRSSAQDAPDYSQIFEKRDVMIPMRDGVRLHTEIYVPKDANGPL
ncbi:MAG: hypothetical protein ACREP9_09035, partial [Candidatus Dormibacteraceae bacterium]